MDSEILSQEEPLITVSVVNFVTKSPLHYIALNQNVNRSLCSHRSHCHCHCHIAYHSFNQKVSPTHLMSKWRGHLLCCPRQLKSTPKRTPIFQKSDILKPEKFAFKKTLYAFLDLPRGHHMIFCVNALRTDETWRVAVDLTSPQIRNI